MSERGNILHGGPIRRQREEYTPRGTNRTPEKGNILHVGSIGRQREGIYSTWDQWDAGEGEYTPRGTNTTPERGNILHVGPTGRQRVVGCCWIERHSICMVKCP
jgi:hypothetical protein